MSTIRTSAMIFLILLGATIFGYYMALSRIPQEVVTSITAMELNRWVVIIGIVVAALLVLVGSYAATGSIPHTTFLPAGLAAGAFAIWSLSVPLSGWQRLDFVHDNQAAVAVVAALLALLFSQFAEGITKQLGRG